jgi:hypothetical protein
MWRFQPFSDASFKTPCFNNNDAQLFSNLIQFFALVSHKILINLKKDMGLEETDLGEGREVNRSVPGSFSACHVFVVL